MTEIAIIEAKATGSDRLTVDVVVHLPDGPHHISRLKYTGKNLYDVPMTCKVEESPIDTHTTYHSSGEMHSKLTKGKLMIAAGNRIVEVCQAHYADKASRMPAREEKLWQRKGQPWKSLRGVERIAQRQDGIEGFVNITALAAGYPPYSDIDADHVFEIDVESLPSDMCTVQLFLVEASAVNALKECIEEITNSWKRPCEFMTVEKVEQFTNFSPWFAIVLFSRKVKTE